jgi:hypothetical protein
VDRNGQKRGNGQVCLNVFILSFSFEHCSTDKGAICHVRLCEFFKNFWFQRDDHSIVTGARKKDDLLMTGISIHLQGKTSLVVGKEKTLVDSIQLDGP